MSLLYLEPLLDEISEEADNARAKFGDQFDLADSEWLAVLTEELGEAAREVLRCRFADDERERVMRRSEQSGIPLEPSDYPQVRLRAEVMQVGAVAARWLAALDAKS